MRKKVLVAIMVLSALAFAAGAGVLLYYWYQDRSDAKVRELVSQLWSGDLAPDGGHDPSFDALLAENPDTIGWLRIDGTSVDDVVMQAPQEKNKYLHLDFYGNYSARGTYYVAEECDLQTCDNAIIYGHHMRDGTMFGALMSYQDPAFAIAHPNIRFHTIYGDHTYTVIAAIPTQILPDSYTGFQYFQYTTTNDAERFEQYRSFILANRLYDTGVDFQFGDRLLTLSTCAYHTQDGRFIVVAKQID